MGIACLNSAIDDVGLPPPRPLVTEDNVLRLHSYIPGFSTSAAQSHMKFVPMVTLSTWQ
jgi:hypothetical protein